MKSFKIIIILVIFLKTGNVLSSENIFHVNNIELNKSLNLSSEELANKAIRKGFEVLKKKISPNRHFLILIYLQQMTGGIDQIMK